VYKYPQGTEVASSPNLHYCRGSFNRGSNLQSSRIYSFYRAEGAFTGLERQGNGVNDEGVPPYWFPNCTP